MKLYLIRHGETDWQLVSERGVKGMAASLAPLTSVGRLQIDTIANDYRLQEAEAVLCSSYARALESAAVISRKLNKPLFVEYDLHEWLPQKNPLVEIDEQLMIEASADLELELSEKSADTNVPWERLSEVRQRVLSVLQRYRQHSTLIVVTHAVVINSIIGSKRRIDHAEIVPFELNWELPSPLKVPISKAKR